MCEINNRGKVLFTVDVRFHHGGKFETNNKGQYFYVGGTVSLKFGLWSNKITYDSVVDTGRSLMNGKPFEAYFKLKGRSFVTGMQRLRNERGMIDFLNSRDEDDKLDLYFVEASKGPNQVSPRIKHHSVCLDKQDESVTEATNKLIGSPISIIRRSPRFTYTSHSIRRSPRFASSPGSPIMDPVRRLEKLPTRRKLSETFERQNEQNTSEDLIITEKQNGKQVVSEYEDAVDGEYDEDINNVYDEGGYDEDINNVYDEGYWTEDSQLSDYEIGNNEVGGDFVEDEELFTDVIDDSLIDAFNKNLNQSCSKARETIRSRSKILNVDDLNVQVGEDSNLASDDDKSVGGSDQEVDPYDTFNPDVDFNKPIMLKVGLKFPSVYELRKAVRQHAIENGYEPFFSHNESARVTIYCRHRCECPWNAKKSRLPRCTCGTKRKCLFRLHATKMEGDVLTFQIKSMHLEHVCVYTTKNRMVTAEFLADKYLEVWRSDPHWRLKATQDRVRLDLGVDVGYYKCWVARARAKMIIWGNSDEQYSRVWDYVATIRKYNPGSSSYVMVERVDRPPPVFQRMYICLAACKEGFKNGCRPLIGVDGCHLKGVYPGMCLVAVTMDGNNNIFPVAWAVVEVENSDSWKWFLELLVKDIGHDEGDGLTMMSDRQKGLIDAMKVVVPKAEIRFCVRHIWANFKQQFSGQAFKDSFWQAAWATIEVEFLSALEGIKFLSKPAYEYVKAIPPKHWSMHAFKTTCKSSMITNNLCESFNAVLKDARDKPILTHMEWMRRYVMKRNYKKREGVNKYEKPFMPYIEKCFKRVIAESRYCQIFESRGTNFEVDYKGGSYTINLVNKVCNCYHWELSGIPCIHVMACILKQRHIPEDYVDQAYSKDKYLHAYTSAVEPMPGVAHWEKTNQEEPLPPLMRRMPGRPSKKKRRKEPGEGSQVKRVKKVNKCSRCGTLGHNIKGCRNVIAAPKTSNTGGRPITNSDWVKSARNKIEQRKARKTSDQAFVSQFSGSQQTVRSRTQP